MIIYLFYSFTILIYLQICIAFLIATWVKTIYPFHHSTLNHPHISTILIPNNSITFIKAFSWIPTLNPYKIFPPILKNNLPSTNSQDTYNPMNIPASSKGSHLSSNMNCPSSKMWWSEMRKWPLIVKVRRVRIGVRRRCEKVNSRSGCARSVRLWTMSGGEVVKNAIGWSNSLRLALKIGNVWCAGT